MESKPEIYIMIPPPLYTDNIYYHTFERIFSMDKKVINEQFPSLIPEIGN